MNTDKDYGGDLCKNHSARSEKEFCRVCPSNLNKKELENVYFTLLENNLDLKTTINSQREKIKILSTKVQRLTALQKTYVGKEPKACCGSKAIITEQKECISELKRSNQCLSERVRQLNMRLCSAKQFLKRSPFQSTSRCNRCTNKNISMSALITKRSEIDLRTAAASSQYLVRDIISSRTADNVIISHEKSVQYDFCDENKCRDHIEELKKENDDLRDELSRVKEEHAAGASRLERELTELRAENVRVRSDRALADDSAQRERAGRARADLRCEELEMEACTARRQVCELQSRLRAADVTRRVAGAIQSHLANVKMARDQTNMFRNAQASKHETSAVDVSSQLLTVQDPLYKPKAAVRTKIPHSVQVDEAFKNSDDSGYTEVNKSQEVDDTKTSSYINQVLLEKIADLQNQVNNLKAFKNNSNNPNESLNPSQEIIVEKSQKSTTAPVEQQIDVKIIYESSDSVITEKKQNKSLIAIQQMDSDKHGATVSKTETVSETNNPVEIQPDCQTEDSKIAKQQGEVNVDTGPRESFKRFERLSNNVSRAPNGFIDSRKFSLQSSRDLHKKKSFIKASSFDENRLSHLHNTKKGSMEKFEARDTNTNKEQTSKRNDSIVPNTEELNIPNISATYILKEKANQSDRETHLLNKAIVKDAESNITNRTKDEKRRGSDSSRGTYSIHKDENVTKLEKKSKDAHFNKNEGNILLNHSTIFHKNLVVADVTRVLNSATSKDNLMGRREFTAREPSAPVRGPRADTPDSTEWEISSLTDLPSEGDEGSPGEKRPPATTTTTTSTTSATDCGSLSEGELPYPRGGTSTATTILSDGEKRVFNNTGKSHSVPVSGTHSMEDTLAAVQRELSRCTLLLRGHVPSAAPAVN